MASESYPNANHNSGAVTTAEWEQLAALGVGTGLVGHPTDTTTVFADGTGTRIVKIRAGKRAVVRGAAWYSGGSDFSLTALSANGAGANRIDRVVLRLDKSSGEVTEEVVEGVAGAGQPALTRDAGTSGVWEFPLAAVTVAPGATTLAEGTVTPQAWYLAAQPVTARTATWPALADESPGLILYDQEADEAYISTGGGWRQLYADSGRTNLSAASGWSVGAYGAHVRRRTRMVTLVGQFTRTGGTLTSGASLLTTLPSGYRPAEPLPIGCYLQGSHPALARLDNTNGQLVLNTYGESTAAGEYVVVPTVTFQAA